MAYLCIYVAAGGAMSCCGVELQKKLVKMRGRQMYQQFGLGRRVRIGRQLAGFSERD